MVVSMFDIAEPDNTIRAVNVHLSMGVRTNQAIGMF